MDPLRCLESQDCLAWRRHGTKRIKHPRRDARTGLRRDSTLEETPEQDGDEARKDEEEHSEEHSEEEHNEEEYSDGRRHDGEPDAPARGYGALGPKWDVPLGPRRRTETWRRLPAEILLAERKRARRREIPKREQAVGEFDAAKQKELDSIRSHEVVKPIRRDELPDGVNVIRSRFICTRRASANHPDGVKRKARLVGLGFEEEMGEFEVNDSPTVSREVLRIVMFVAAIRGWRLRSDDVATAFLQADTRTEGERLVAIKPPPEAGLGKGWVWLLRKSLYGLRSAPKAWFLTLARELRQLGWRQSTSDPALWYLSGVAGVHGVMAVHVDDLLSAGDEVFEEAMEQLRKQLKFGDTQFGEFTHLGMRIIQGPDGSITCDQETYIGELDEVAVRDGPEDGPVSEGEKADLQGLVGELLWLACQTRPDVAVDVSMIAQHLAEPTRKTVREANGVVRRLKEDKGRRLTFPAMRGAIDVVLFADAAFMNCEDMRSQGGLLMMVRSRDEQSGAVRSAALTWKSKKGPRVVTSTFAAETLQARVAVDVGIGVRDMLDELLTGTRSREQTHRTPLHICVDCKSLVDYIPSMRARTREWRLVGVIEEIKEAVALGEVDTVRHVGGEENPADGLTKRAAQAEGEDTAGDVRGAGAANGQRQGGVCSRHSRHGEMGIHVDVYLREYGR